MDPQSKPTTILDHPGVHLGLGGVILVTISILWVVVVPESDTPIGGAEITAIIGGLLVLAGALRGAWAFAEDDGRPRE